MPSPQVATPLKYSTLTATVNEIRRPYTSVFDRYFSRRRALTTEDVEIGKWFRGRPMAPFVRKGDMPHPVSVRTKSFEKIATPMISLDTPVTPDDLMFERQPGVPYFVGASQQMREIQRRINDKQVDQVDMIAAREEWMACQLIEHAMLTYQAGESPEVAEHFTVDFARDPALKVTIAGASDKWSHADSKPWDDTRTARKEVMKRTGLKVNDAIVGPKVAEALRNHDKLDLKRHYNNVDAGRSSYEQQFGGEEGGPIWLMRLEGVDFWEYDVQHEELDGSTVNMISDNVCIFLPRGGQHGRRVYYGAIPDLKLLRRRRMAAQRFAKYYETEEPSEGHLVVKTRPMPVLRRPNGIYTLYPVDP